MKGGRLAGVNARKRVLRVKWYGSGAREEETGCDHGRGTTAVVAARGRVSQYRGDVARLKPCPNRKPPTVAERSEPLPDYVVFAVMLSW